jgi:YesN/AraC family two-component response regulator
VRKYTLRSYEELGYPSVMILEARHAEDAIVLVSQSDQSIDLLRTDVIMRRMNGEALYQALRPHQPPLKVI